MSEALEKYKAPTLQEVTEDIEVAYKNDQLNFLLSQKPPEKWIKEHPFVKGWKYLPIDKIEHLLRKIFKRYRIEVLGSSTAFNGVEVRVRVHYLHPIWNEWDFHDGIGAIQLQTRQGASPADLGNINNGAVSMAFPMAKTLAVKDACDHFGDLFGANLNRKDVVEFKPDIPSSSPSDKVEVSVEIEAEIKEAQTGDQLNAIKEAHQELKNNPKFMQLLFKQRQVIDGNQSDKKPGN